ncbi:10111_t:CDS:2, partial [Ambispora gerdemannii]
MFMIILLWLADADDNAIELLRFIRYGHTANYNKIDNKLYFVGGVDRHNSTSADFFTLEISNSLNITAPNFEQKILNPTPPNVAFITSEIKNSKIYVFGSFEDTELFQGFVIDISSKPSWNKLDVLTAFDSPQVPQERTMNAIVDSIGKIYVFGKFIQQPSPQSQSTSQQSSPQPQSTSQQSFPEQTYFQTSVSRIPAGGPSDELPRPTHDISSVKSPEQSTQSKLTPKLKAPLQQRAPDLQQTSSAMFIYNINTETWIIVNIKNIKDYDQFKLPASDFTATYLKVSNSIIYIGGKSSDGSFIPMNQIWIYSISDRTLTSKNTDENNIVDRYRHSACLVQNKIIVYGGLSTPPLDSSNALVILEIDDGNYNWKTPKVTSNTQPIVIPYYHTATIIDDTYMIVAFEANGMLIGDTNQINNSGD